MTFEYGPDRADFWDDYRERVGWGVDSQDTYQRFLDMEQTLSGLFDIWADPNEDDAEQSAAYGDFWTLMEEEFGLEKDSFDWHTFREQYG